MKKAFEVNFDGLVGPTHHYGGLSYGNIASTTHKALVSNPREAALQGLRKMKSLRDLGLKQAVLPPQERPDLRALRRLGFSGTDSKAISRAAKQAPEILSACYSASSMWTANAATVGPSADAPDDDADAGKVHFTAANLTSKFHRSIEPEQTARTLRAIFSDPRHFVHHDPLPSGPYLGDEGAANHTRFCENYEKPGLQFFVYGKRGFGATAVDPEPKRYPARQTLEASQAVARLHQIPPRRLFFAQQNPLAIDAGAFHNDVASVGNRNFFFSHEEAFLNQAETLEKLKLAYEASGGGELRILQVASVDVTMEEAVRSYLFNSQILSLPSGQMVLIAPMECQEMPRVKDYLGRMLQESLSPIREVHYFDLRQSMRNGGGPACLRLRVVLTEDELKAANPGVFLTDSLYERLVRWVEKHYRDRLSQNDLADPRLADESRSALDELTSILGVGSIYPFQLSS